jgi:ribonuclease HI
VAAKRERSCEMKRELHKPTHDQDGDQKAWLSVKDLQSELGIGNDLAYRLVRSGRIPSVKLGGLIRIHRPTMERALLENPLPGKAREATKSTVEVYTDGGCRGNPGVGGWAALIYRGPKPEEIYGAARLTTNNQMELRAAIEGLKRLETPSTVRVFSDSTYLTDAFNKGWLASWERNGWKNAARKPVKNINLWRELAALTRKHDVTFVEIDGHAGVGANERCDTLVQLAIERQARIMR